MISQRPASRRQAMRLMLAAAGGAAVASHCPDVAAAADSQRRLRLGISTLGFTDHSNRQLAEKLAADRIKLVQLFLTQTDSRYWKYNTAVDVSDLTPQRCGEIAEAYRSHGIEIHSIGVYANLIHPDESQRRAGLDYFQAMMKIGSEMGVHTFITEAGHYHSEGPEPRVAHHFQDGAWPRMIAVGRQLAELAERHAATVLIEAFYRGFLASAKRTRQFLEEVNSPRLRSLLDPANLLEVNDLSEMFAQLGPHIDCLHAKDRKHHIERGVAAGQGDLDYPRLLGLISEQTPHAPLIVEYVGTKDYQQALAHIRAMMRQADIQEA